MVDFQKKLIRNLQNISDINNTLLNSTYLNETSTNSTLLDQKYVWPAAILTSFGFLFLSLIITYLIIILYKKNLSKNCLNVLNSILVSLAVGSLAGDALVHIIPDVFGSEEHSEEPSEEPSEKANEKNPHICSLLIVIGFLAFFIIEKVLTNSAIMHSHGLEDIHGSEHGHGLSHDHDCHGKDNKVNQEHNHAHDCKEEENKEDKNVVYLKLNNNIEIELESKSNKVENLDNSKQKEEKQKNEEEINKILLNENQLKTKNNLKTQEPLESTQTPSENKEDKKGIFSLTNTKPVGSMIKISSFIHNVMDGIAIGIVFASRKSNVILSTVIAIVLHEIPKELGDAGILITSNYTFKQVIFWNVIDNVTSIIGAIVGVAVGNMDETSHSYTLAFVAGNFLYISLADMIPEIMRNKGWYFTFFQISFILLGLGIMFLILIFK